MRPEDLAALPWAHAALFAAVILGGVVAVVTVRLALHRRARRSGLENSSYVTVHPPPEVDPKSAVLAWRHFHAIEHRAWRRFWHGQPHLIAEYAFSGQQLHIRFWIPSQVDPALVVHALKAAWPAATCETTTAIPPLPTTTAKEGR